jgi:hypothetical protein
MAKTKIEKPVNPEIGKAMEANAVELAHVLDAALMQEIDRLNAAQQEWEGGKFVVMHRLTSAMTPAQLKALPDPKADTGNNPAHYVVEVIRITDKGERKSEWKKKYYYDELTLNLPGIVAKNKLIGQIERSLGDDEKVNKSDIPDHIMNWSPDYRRNKMKQLQTEVNNAITSVTGAFELFHQFRKMGELTNVDAFPVYAIGEDGKECDGLEGRPFRVEASKTPIVLASTVKSRVLIDRKMVSIGQFLRYDLDKAREENGGTYDSVLATVKKQKPEEQGAETVIGNAQDQSRPQSIKTPDTFGARLVDVGEYLTASAEDKSHAAWEAIDKYLHADGNDEAFMSACEVHALLGTLIGSPKDQAKYQGLIAEANKAAA